MWGVGWCGGGCVDVCIGFPSVICMLSFLGGNKGLVGKFLFASFCCFLYLLVNYTSCNLRFLNWVIAISSLFLPFEYPP